MAGPSLSDVAPDPEWLPHTYDVSGTQLTFVRVPMPARPQLMFLSDEHFADQFVKATFPVRDVTAAAVHARQAPIHFIFHTSFCCSTLLARALDIPGKSIALREPDVLINLANRFIRSEVGERDRLELVLRLLERPPERDETVIVKPTNFANRLLEPALELRRESRVVLLYSDVETFLRSLLKRGMFGRIFGRKLFNQLSGWAPLQFGYSPAELLEQTDAQIAALAWLMQIDHFDRVARKMGSQRALVLDSASLLADPASALGRIQSLFDLKLDPGEIDAIATGPAFSSHSKFTGRDFDLKAREDEHRAVSEVHAEEIGMVAKWIEAVASQLGVPITPGS